jgi:hypothetical protein
MNTEGATFLLLQGVRNILQLDNGANRSNSSPFRARTQLFDTVDGYMQVNRNTKGKKFLRFHDTNG